MNQLELPIAVIGAGPIGLAAAAHLVSKGATPIVFEAGSEVGASIREWGHVRLFSPWRYNIDATARNMLEAAGWQAPDPDHFPTGGELVEQYLEPLAALPQIAPHIRLGSRMRAITRQGFDKLKTEGRDDAPFLLHVEAADGREQAILARAVIDASGTYRSPNPLGAAGLPAIGEAGQAGRIFYGIPDVLGAQRARYAGRRTLVAGSGHSAFNALLDLADLAEQAPGTRIVWAIRRAAAGQMYGGGANDLLPERGSLGMRVQQLVDLGVVELHMGFKIAQIDSSEDGLVVSDGQHDLPPVDEIVAATGFRPDLAPLSELRLSLDPRVESPVALAPLIDPNIHSCGTVRPHGAAELRQPERDLYIVGMKSYGRAPTFLMLTGYEQVRSVVCALTGDIAGAQAIELELPETGVCFTDRQIGGGCCGTSTSTLELVEVGGAGRGVSIPLHAAEPAPAGSGGCCG